jgi:hypothetical protein
MKFDVIVGNPPFQEPPKTKRHGGSPKSIWDKFVLKSLENLNENGYLALIHPPQWRKPNNKIWPILSSLQIEYLEIHNNKDYYGAREVGIKVFNVWVAFDWYIIKNCKCNNKTEIEDYSGKKYILNLKDWPWLPSGEYNLFKKLISGNEKLDVIYDGGSYHPQNKKIISLEKNSTYKYPVVNTIDLNGINFVYSNTKNRGHFNIPKIIIGDGGHIYPIEDLHGKYGLSPHAIGFTVNSKIHAKRILNTFKSEKFKKMIWMAKWGNFATDYRMFKYFKKDFWKYFVDENGNEI